MHKEANYHDFILFAISLGMNDVIPVYLDGYENDVQIE